MNYTGKYFFISTVRTEEGVIPSIFAFDTVKDAEIKYHQEVGYGLQLDTIILAHYSVINEYGVVQGNLEKTIDNMAVTE